MQQRTGRGIGGGQMDGDWLRGIAGQLAARRDAAGGAIPGQVGQQINPMIAQFAQGVPQGGPNMQAAPAIPRGVGGVPNALGQIPQLPRTDVPQRIPAPMAQGAAPMPPAGVPAPPQGGAGPQRGPIPGQAAQFAPGWTQRLAGAFAPQATAAPAQPRGPAPAPVAPEEEDEG